MSMHDVAIVGMGCRFPHATHVGEYWKNITDARVCFSEIPAERWNHALFYDPSPRAIDKTYARKVGLLDDVRSFSAMHYGLAPLRVSVMDPQHRLLLDTVRVALEDAGYREAMVAGSRTACTSARACRSTRTSTPAGCARARCSMASGAGRRSRRPRSSTRRSRTSRRCARSRSPGTS
jgi:acyl transferase domain-containing protein